MRDLMFIIVNSRIVERLFFCRFIVRNLKNYNAEILLILIIKTLLAMVH